MTQHESVQEAAAISEVDHLGALAYNFHHEYITQLATFAATELDNVRVRTAGLGPFRRVVDVQPTYEVDPALQSFTETQLLRLVMDAVAHGYNHGKRDAQRIIEGES